MKSRYVWMILVFLLLCIGIAVSQWYAYNVNVPRYQSQLKHKN